MHARPRAADPSRMTCAATTMIARARVAGIDLFIIPRPGEPEGMAFFDGKTRRINIAGEARDAALARVVAHELAHHALRHAEFRTSEPSWRLEYDAERLALRFLSGLVDAPTMAALQLSSREYLRPRIQPFLDAGITAHGEVAAGLRVGCHIEPEMLDAWRDQGMPRADDAEVPL